MKALLSIFALFSFYLFASPFEVLAQVIDEDSFDEAVAEAVEAAVTEAVELAVAEAIEDLASSEEMEALTAQIQALETTADGMFTQADLDAAVADATAGMVTQAQYDAVVAENATIQAAYDAVVEEASDGAVYTQEEYEDLALEAIHEGISITASGIGLACANKTGQFNTLITEGKYEYMEGICASGEVGASGACDN
tara:strand:- start:248 stop:838 length:591 start_codon:yes stop_codon:yes gene_type:complete